MFIVEVSTVEDNIPVISDIFGVYPTFEEAKYAVTVYNHNQAVNHLSPTIQVSPNSWEETNHRYNIHFRYTIVEMNEVKHHV